MNQVDKIRLLIMSWRAEALLLEVVTNHLECQGFSLATGRLVTEATRLSDEARVETYWTSQLLARDALDQGNRRWSFGIEALLRLTPELRVRAWRVKGCGDAATFQEISDGRELPPQEFNPTTEEGWMTFLRVLRGAYLR